MHNKSKIKHNTFGSTKKLNKHQISLCMFQQGNDNQ